MRVNGVVAGIIIAMALVVIGVVGYQMLRPQPLREPIGPVGGMLGAGRSPAANAPARPAQPGEAARKGKSAPR